MVVGEILADLHCRLQALSLSRVYPEGARAAEHADAPLLQDLRCHVGIDVPGNGPHDCVADLLRVDGHQGPPLVQGPFSGVQGNCDCVGHVGGRFEVALHQVRDALGPDRDAWCWGIERVAPEKVDARRVGHHPATPADGGCEILVIVGLLRACVLNAERHLLGDVVEQRVRLDGLAPRHHFDIVVGVAALYIDASTGHGRVGWRGRRRGVCRPRRAPGLEPRGH